MAEYIEREAALRTAHIMRPEDKCLETELMKIPAADVAPVVHGRWIDNGIPGSMLSGCSVCGFTCGAYSFFYCPHCGARMDGYTNKEEGRQWLNTSR